METHSTGSLPASSSGSPAFIASATATPAASCLRPPSPAPGADDTPPFRLLDLPQELIVAIVHALNERDPSPTFPSGPSTDLLSLAATSRWFNAVCQPLVWRSVRYKPEELIRPVEWRRTRDLRSLRELLRKREEQGGTLPIVQLSLEQPTESDDAELDGNVEEREADAEEAAYVEIIEAAARKTLQVLFLKDTEVRAANAARLIRAIADSPRVSAVRLNQVDFIEGKPGVVPSLPPLTRLKTLQIMHSDPELFGLADKCPSLDSLLLWPSTRRVGPHIESIKSLLPHLLNLSLDSVHGASAFRSLADEILRLSQSGLTLPLEELFLEGPSRAADLSVLVSAISHLPSLRRLSLYQVKKPTPALFHDIVTAVPQLEALTIVSGDCQDPVEWPAPLDEYLPHLRKLTKLRFFAFDRMSPPRFDSVEGSDVWLLQKRLEFDALSQVARAAPSLREAVAITSDVSEGSSGYFAQFRREKGRTRITLKHKTVNDFLIGYDRWVKVEDD
ncbi:hypothetical protein JCM10213_004434 [Rhodosporidiobolus nylandii]